MNETRRGTGRTTRMIEYGIEQAKQGVSVYLMFANQAHADLWKGKYPNDNVKFETEETLGNFDWQLMRLVGAHHNCLVLVDHYAIELYLDANYGFANQMLKQFDLTT